MINLIRDTEKILGSKSKIITKGELKTKLLVRKSLVAKVNIDENPEVPSNYGIMSIPTLILFKNGKSVSSQICIV